MADPLKGRRGPVLMRSKCIVCEHPIAAVSMAALRESIADHTGYVNSQLDRDTDPHFEDGRLLALVEN